MSEQSIGDGGPAFSTRHGSGWWRDGMSMLDWFAGQAINGLNACESNSAESHQALAFIAYDQAEAMLREKRKRQESAT